MDFQRMGKKTNAGRFERGYLKVTTENLTSWTLSRREKPPKTNFERCPLLNITRREIFFNSGIEKRLRAQGVFSG